jgi:hypothetical protein
MVAVLDIVELKETHLFGQFRQSDLHMPLGRRMQRTISTKSLMRELKALFRVRFRVDNAYV